VAARRETSVFFEAPHRMRETLEAMHRVLGDRHVVVCRELTKLHEEWLRGPLSRVLPALATPRGEFTVLVSPAPPQETAGPLPEGQRLLEEFEQLTESSGLSRRSAISALAERYALPSREVYAAIERARSEARLAGTHTTPEP